LPFALDEHVTPISNADTLWASCVSL